MEGDGIDLDVLDGERPHRPFLIRVDGRRITLRDARDVRWRILLYALGGWKEFTALLVPDDHVMPVLTLPWWKMDLLMAAYRRHHGLCATRADDLRLAGAVSNYGRAIERDLAWRGINLGDVWRERRWRYLLNLLDGLPRDSAYSEALANDDELALMLIDRKDTGRQRTPARRVTEFSTEVELLTVLADRVAEVVQAVAALGGAKPRRPTPLPRPVTAVDRARRRRREQRHKALVARVLPPRPGTPPGTQPGTPPPE